MSAWLKALSLPLALATLTIFSVSCGSNINLAEVRVLNAIPDSQPIDVYINGNNILTNLAFGQVQPNTNPASYISVTSGSEALESFPRGENTNPISPTATLSLNGSTEYTIIGVGFELSNAAPLVLTDNNKVPVSGNVEFRVVNTSVNSPTDGFDVYFVAPGTSISSFTPQITSLGNGQVSPYESFPFLAGGYSVIITASGGKTPLVTETSNSPAASIRTLVIVDNVGGNNGISPTPLVLNDLN